MNNTNIKILIGYHKPATLIKDDVFVPIHLGRALANTASKDGKMSQEDYQWMLDNMIGDDTGDNISEENLYLNELTALYWAWKNYDKLGNPEYFGFMHYRRHLCFDNHNKEKTNKYGLLCAKQFDDYYIKKYKLDGKTVENIIDNTDIITVEKTNLKKLGEKNNYEQFINSPYHHIEDFDKVIDITKEIYPQYTSAVDKYLKSGYSYFTNIFVMRKEIFFEYCEWLFNIVFEARQKLNLTNYSPQEVRALAYIAERMFGIFLLNKKADKKIKIKELKRTFVENTDIIRTIYKRNDSEIPIIMSVDNNYVPYLGVAIKSIVENSSKENEYTIYILDDGISKIYKTRLASLETENIKLRYIDITKYLNKFDSNIFYICEHFAISTYYRFFIPQIFKNFEKVVYCDCDAIFLDDIAKLYKIDIEDNMIGAVHDTEAIRELTFERDEYFDKVLKLNNPHNYFQAGLLLLNISKLIEEDFFHNCIATLKRIKKPRFVDQCILNIVCENKVKFLDAKWNVENHLHVWRKDLINELPNDIYQEYENNLQQAKFLHYTGSEKPWQNPASFNADLWWKYAQKTPFYEEIIYKNAKKYIEKRKSIIPMKYTNLLQRIFSIKNDKSRPDKVYKVVTILGLKLKLKKRV